MRRPGDVDAITAVVDLILEPLVLETLVAIREGKSLEDVCPPDGDVIMLTVPVQRLTALGAVSVASAGPVDGYELTAKGQRLLQALEHLDSLIAARRTGGGREPVG